jgi:hypothetical protein
MATIRASMLEAWKAFACIVWMSRCLRRLGRYICWTLVSAELAWVDPRFLGRIDWLEHGPSRDILCIYNRPSNTRISRSFWRVLEIGMEERRDGSTLLLSPVQLTICEHIAIITSDVRTKLEHSSAPTHGQPQHSDMDRFNKSHPPQLHNRQI